MGLLALTQTFVEQRKEFFRVVADEVVVGDVLHHFGRRVPEARHKYVVLKPTISSLTLSFFI